MVDNRTLDGRISDNRILDSRILDGRVSDGRVLDGRISGSRGAAGGPPVAALVGNRLRSALGARGWPRPLFLRRFVSVALLVGAVLLTAPPSAARASPPGQLVVAARDLAPGVSLTAADVVQRPVPRALLPRGALATVGAAVGRVLGGAVRAGEPITDVRLLGPAEDALTAGRLGGDIAAVPVRLADAGVAGLLHPGSRVDVITAADATGDGDISSGEPDANTGADPDGAADDGAAVSGAVVSGDAGGAEPQQQAYPVLAEDATVLTVRDSDQGSGQPGRLVVLALPRQDATRVAAISLRQSVTVTLR